MPIPIRNIVLMAGSALLNKAVGTRRPLNLMLALTDRCTGRCVYCQLPQRNSPEMSRTEIETLLDEAADAGCQRVGLWGGEPLLRDDIGPIIRQANGRGMFVTIDTNGHLLPEKAEAISLANHINISLDGNEQGHDANRGVGTFQKTMRGIEVARGKGMPVWTITVLSKHNVDQVDWLLATAREMGFLTTFQVLHHNDEIGCNRGLYASDDQLRDVAELLIARKQEGAPIASSLGYLKLLATWPDFTVNRYPSYGGYPKCLAGRLYCNVDVDGSMYPCSLFVDEMKNPPNVRTLGFKGAFDALQIPNCNACLAACFTEYNLLYGLDIGTGLNWVGALLK